MFFIIGCLLVMGLCLTFGLPLDSVGIVAFSWTGLLGAGGGAGGGLYVIALSAGLWALAAPGQHGWQSSGWSI
ncbi:MAG: hypothetical protein ACK5LN_10615 [Propioniciclava sp.]